MADYNPNLSMCERVRLQDCGCHKMVTVAGDPILCIPCMWDSMGQDMLYFKKKTVEGVLKDE